MKNYLDISVGGKLASNTRPHVARV